MRIVVLKWLILKWMKEYRERRKKGYISDEKRKRKRGRRK